MFFFSFCCTNSFSYFKIINKLFIYWYNLCMVCVWTAFFLFLLSIFNACTVILQVNFCHIDCCSLYSRAYQGNTKQENESAFDHIYFSPSLHCFKEQKSKVVVVWHRFVKIKVMVIYWVCYTFNLKFTTLLCKRYRTIRLLHNYYFTINIEYVIANENPILLIKTRLGWWIKIMQHKSIQIKTSQ